MIHAQQRNELVYPWEASYRGEVNVTSTGISCQRWDTQYPHKHFRTPKKYPDAGLEHNYCRSPDKEYRPWCYTINPSIRWWYCNITSSSDETSTEAVDIKTAATYPYYTVPTTSWTGDELLSAYKSRQYICNVGKNALPEKRLKISLSTAVKKISGKQSIYTMQKWKKFTMNHNETYSGEKSVTDEGEQPTGGSAYQSGTYYAGNGTTNGGYYGSNKTPNGVHSNGSFQSNILYARADGTHNKEYSENNTYHPGRYHKETASQTGKYYETEGSATNGGNYNPDSNGRNNYNHGDVKVHIEYGFCLAIGEMTSRWCNLFGEKYAAIDKCILEYCPNDSCKAFTCRGKDCIMLLRDPCINSNCSVNAHCFMEQATGSHKCQCKFGYIGDGYNCTDPCINNNCHAKAYCFPDKHTGSFKCQCKDRFIGNGYNCRGSVVTSTSKTTSSTASVSSIAKATSAASTATKTIFSFTKSNEEVSPSVRTKEAAVTRARTTMTTSKEPHTFRMSSNSPDPCIHNNCSINARCTVNQAADSYECQCKEGYNGTGYNCQEITTTTTTTSNPVTTTTTTTSTQSSSAQMSSNLTTAKFSDDPCLNNNCSLNSCCQATEDNYTCTCWGGFTGDGFNCIKLLDIFKENIKITNVSDSKSAAAIASNLNEIVSSYNASKEDFKSVIIPTVANIVSAAVNGSFEVSRSFLKPVAGVLSKITKNYFKRKKSGVATNSTERAEKDNIIQSITGLARAVKFEGEGFDEVTESFTIKVQKYNETSGDGLSANFSSMNVKLPKEIFKKQKIQKRQTIVELFAAFVFFDDTTLFETGDSFGDVISIDVGEPGSVQDLETPVTIEHKVDSPPGRKTTPEEPAQVTKTQQSCVYWDEQTRDWATNGCCLKADTNPPQCSCDHLTNFALLVSERISTDVILDIVSDVGCYLSILALFLTVVIHLYFRESRKKHQTQFLIHICINLIVAYSLFVGGISQTANKTDCDAIAVLLHYFFLSSWCWMAVYCYEMRRSILASRDLPSRYTHKTSLFAYGVPLIIVAVTAIATLGVLDQKQPSLYCDEVADPLTPSMYRSENYCWLHEYPLMIGFLLPVAIMLFYNILVFIQVVRNLKNIEPLEDGSSPKLIAGTAITLTAVVGIGWGFGYIVLLSPGSKFASIISWFFAAFVVFQGVAIFVMTIFQCKDLRKKGTRNNCGNGSNGDSGMMIQVSPSTSSNDMPPPYEKIDEKSEPAMDYSVL